MSQPHRFHAPLVRLTSVIVCFVLLLVAVAGRPFDEAKSSHAINLTSNIQTQPQQPVKHFGYLGPNTDSDLSRVHSYTDFTYVDGEYGQSIVDLATRVKNNSMRSVIDLGKVLWCPTSLVNDTWHLCTTGEVSYQSRWSNWVSVNSSVLDSSYVLAFSVMTEPVQRTVPKADLETAVALVKQTFPQIPTLVAVGNAEVNRSDFYLPNNPDWIGLAAYYIHPNLDSQLAQQVATLKSKKQSWQRMAYTLDGFFTCPHQQGSLTLDNMDSIAQEWYTFVSRDTEAILIGVFDWYNVGAEGDLGSMSFPQHVLDKHAAIGAAIFAGRYPTYQGNFDGANCPTITGWAWDASQPNTPISVDIYYDTGGLIATVRADQFRQDLVNAGIGNGRHGFTFSPPAVLLRNVTHQVTIKYSGLDQQLTNSPRAITCPSSLPAYEGYIEVADCNKISGWAADRNRLNTPIMVTAVDDNSAFIATVVASDLRSDVGAYLHDNGKHGFTIQIPPCLKDGSVHTPRLYFDVGGPQLTNSPLTLTCATRSNFAAASVGTTVTASSTYSAGYPASAVNNGDRKGMYWSVGGGWNDATTNSYPDWVQLNFNGPKTIDEIDVFTLQDNYGNPADPTETMTFTTYGITAFDVQYFDGSNWVTVPGGSTSGNNKVWRKFSFAPVTTTKIRVLVNNALASYSRITEVEAWGW